jgi:hypothetical protein
VSSESPRQSKKKGRTGQGSKEGNMEEGKGEEARKEGSERSGRESEGRKQKKEVKEAKGEWKEGSERKRTGSEGRNERSEGEVKEGRPGTAVPEGTLCSCVRLVDRCKINPRLGCCVLQQNGDGTAAKLP